MEQSLAGLISDRATDEVLEALTRYKRGMGIPDSPNTTHNETPDIVRSRSSHVSCDDGWWQNVKVFRGLLKKGWMNVNCFAFAAKISKDSFNLCIRRTY